MDFSPLALGICVSIIYDRLPLPRPRNEQSLEREHKKNNNLAASLEFSTPSLYFPQEEEADDDARPECEYGTDCYRKNPQHRRDFKHTKKPRPPKRKVGKESSFPHSTWLKNEGWDVLCELQISFTT